MQCDVHLQIFIGVKYNVVAEKMNHCSSRVKKMSLVLPITSSNGDEFRPHRNAKSCYYHIRQLRCIRSHLDSKTASTIATSIVHSKLDYCNCLYHNLPKSQIARLQHIQNSLARAVVKAPKTCHHSHPALSSLAENN